MAIFGIVLRKEPGKLIERRNYLDILQFSLLFFKQPIFSL